MSTQPSKPEVLTLLRDVILFGIGIAIILKQAGILLSPPEGGVQLELLLLGALFCNGPLVLQYLALRRGVSLPQQPEPASEQGSPSVPPSASSSGGDG